MTMYKYYAVIHQEDDAFIVNFPDIENCFTHGETLPHAVEMAQDVLGLMLIDYEDKGNIPTSSPAMSIEVPEDASLVYIEVNTDDFREHINQSL